MTEKTIDPRIERSRAAILPVAVEHFLQRGFLAANIDDIAADARVSKRTIYNIYGGKERLFREILAEIFITAETYSQDLSETLATADDIERALEAAGAELARIVLSDRVIRLRRLLIGEAERFPELASEYWCRAPGRVISTLAETLEDFARRGLLELDDPQLASEHFAYLVVGAPLDRALFNTQRQTSHKEINARARQGVSTFLRAYGTSRSD